MLCISKHKDESLNWSLPFLIDIRLWCSDANHFNYSKIHKNVPFKSIKNRFQGLKLDRYSKTQWDDYCSIADIVWKHRSHGRVLASIWELSIKGQFPGGNKQLLMNFSLLYPKRASIWRVFRYKKRWALCTAQQKL